MSPVNGRFQQKDRRKSPIYMSHLLSTAETCIEDNRDIIFTIYDDKTAAVRMERFRFESYAEVREVSEVLATLKVGGRYLIPADACFHLVPRLSMLFTINCYSCIARKWQNALQRPLTKRKSTD